MIECFKEKKRKKKAYLCTVGLPLNSAEWSSRLGRTESESGKNACGPEFYSMRRAANASFSENQA